IHVGIGMACDVMMLLIFCVAGAQCFFFFFQAEDGIRDLIVTGVQTCALPIYAHPRARCPEGHAHGRGCSGSDPEAPREVLVGARSEERRVGKECRCRWWPDP